MKQYAAIIGASKGIGQGVAISLARLGYETLLIGRTVSGLQETSDVCNQFCASHIIEGDITNSLPAIAQRIESITSTLQVAWLGSAGYSEDPIRESSTDEIRQLIRSGYEAPVEFVHRLYPLLKAGQAHIIGACSDWSNFGSGGPSIFGSTKVALSGFLDKLRVEAQADGLRVTSLKMGNVGNLEGYGLDDVERQRSETGTRMVSVADVCEAVAFILSRKTGVVSELTLLPGGAGI